MRIHVTGNAGAGKTTPAKRIGNDLNLPIYGLDQVVWQPGWKKTDPILRDQLEQELIEKPDWVIEGVSHLVRRSADVTIFLDVPRHRCMTRIIRRSLPYLSKLLRALLKQFFVYLEFHRPRQTHRPAYLRTHFTGTAHDHYLNF